MSHLFRRTLSLFTVAALALGGTVVGLSPAQAAAEVNVIPDSRLRECIATAMHDAGTGASPGHPGYSAEPDSISKDDLQSLLNAWNGRGWNHGIYCSGVASLEGLNVIAGLNHADRFRSFSSQGGTITDVTELTGLPSLRDLDLRSNQIVDISAVRGFSSLQGLTSLSLSDNEIIDITPLAGFTKLESLNLDGNQITDIAPLTRLTDLWNLRLSSNQITNITALTGKSALYYLFLSDNQIVDISPLAGCNDLYIVDLSGNQIVDMTALAGKANLAHLYLSDNHITTVPPLVGPTGNTELNLDNNEISDISGLAGLTGLNRLYLSGNRITDVAPLAGLTYLSSLDLSGNQIVDISPLAGLTLYKLNLANNKVADISSFASLLNATTTKVGLGQTVPQAYLRVEHVSFNGNQITDLSSLARNGDGQVHAGDSAGLASEYAGSWGGFMGQTTPPQAAVAGTTVALPTVRTASDSTYPIIWEVTSGDAVLNPNGTITYSSVGPVQLAWSNPMPAISGDPSTGPTQTVTVSTFTGIVSVNVTAGSSQPGTPSAPDSEADKDIVVATTTGGAARFADGQDSYTITAAVASKDGTPLTGFAANLTATAPADVSVGAWKDNGDGTYSALVTSTAPGNYEVRVALDGTTIGTIPVNFIAATVSQTVRLLNESLHAEGLGFLPGEEVQVTVHSDPIDLGRLTADGRGALAVDFTIPAKFALGRHTVEFVGATSGKVVVAFDVVAASGAKSSAGVSTGGVVLASESAPMGIALAFTCLIAAAFAFAMTRIRPRWAMR